MDNVFDCLVHLHYIPPSLASCSVDFFHISIYSDILGCCALEGLFDAEGCVHCFHHDVTAVLYHIRWEEVSFLLRSDEDQLPVYNSFVGCARSHP